MLISVETLGLTPLMHTAYIMPENADVQALLKALELKTEQVMLVFVDTELATLRTPLHDGAHVTLCAYLCGG